MKTAYSYVRFSTRSQLAGDSLSRQLLRARAYAKTHDLELDENSYQDLGISAFKGKNASAGALGAFLQGVDDGVIPKHTTLLVESLDRISRANIMDALPLFMSIINRGVTVVTLVDNSIYTRAKVIKDHGMTLFGSMMVLIRAHEESVMKSVRAKSGIKARLDRGLKSGPAPFWLKTTADRTAFDVVEKQADIVRKMFWYRCHAVGSLRIAQHLNKEHGWKWGSPQVARLLKNPAVIGIRLSQAGHEPREEYYPAVVDKKTFFLVQDLMSADIKVKRGRRPPDEPNLFAGLARCSKCGGSLRFFRENANVSQRYLKCYHAVSKACSAGFVNYDALEKEVIGWLLLDQDDALIQLAERKPNKMIGAATRIEELRARQQKLVELAGSDLSSIPALRASLLTTEIEIRELTKAELENPDEDALFAERAWELVERHENAKLSGDNDALYEVRSEMKVAFQRSISKITVHPERRIGDVHHCKFDVTLRSRDGELHREYTRPALIRVKGVYNGTNAPTKGR